MIKLSVVIVAYKDMEAVKRCLESLPIAEWLEILVIDNSFNNRGFGRACNQAAAHASGDVILFLNPDCELVEGELQTGVSNFVEDPKLGIVGSKLMDKNGHHVRSYSQQPTATTAPIVYSVLNRILAKTAMVRHFWLYNLGHDRLSEVGVVSGAALWIRKEVFDRVGKFDERMFLYWEEVDLCRRVLAKDYTVVYDPQITFAHEGETSTRIVKDRALQWFKDSRLMFFRKSFGLIRGLLIETWITITEEWRFILATLLLLSLGWLYYWSGFWSVWRIAWPGAYWLSLGAAITLWAGTKEVWFQHRLWQRIALTAAVLIAMLPIPKLWPVFLGGAVGWMILDAVTSWRKIRNSWLYLWLISLVVLSGVVLVKASWTKPTMNMEAWHKILQTAKLPTDNNPRVACLGCTEADKTIIGVWNMEITDPGQAEVIIALPPYNDYQYPNVLTKRMENLLLIWPQKTF